jgi:hypothetical protein
MGTQVSLITTACYSGGWAMTPDFNSTTLAAAAEKTTSNAWLPSHSIGRTCGSIFTSTLIETLSSATTPLINELDGVVSAAEDSRSSLQPPDPSLQQTETYNAFCHSILEVCENHVHRLWEQQAFTFSAQNDEWENSWTGRTGIPLAYFEQRWNNLSTFPYSGPDEMKAAKDPSPTNLAFSEESLSRTGGVSGITDPVDEMTAHIRHGRILPMARLFLETCPNDWTQGREVAWGAALRGYVKGDPEVVKDKGPYILATIRFRWEMAIFCDYIISALQLPIPNDEICIMWNEYEWQRSIIKEIPDWDKRHTYVWHALLEGGFLLSPREDQGPPFYRPLRYIACALVQANKPKDETAALMQVIMNFMDQAKKFNHDRVCNNHKVRDHARNWIQSIGSNIRRSVSHNRRSRADTGLSSKRGSHHEEFASGSGSGSGSR